MWRNNVENTKRLKMQLDHDAEQRRVERERSLQRHIYLEVAEAMAQWQEYLATFAFTHLSAQETGQIIHGAAQKLSKAYVIATPETMKTLDKLNLFFGQNVSLLSEKNYHLFRTSQRIAELRKDV